MITRIVLHNFMAHEHAVFDLTAGLTVLTGPNNTGKSAVVEALRCVAENPAPKHHIRHGAKEARVEVHLEEGYRVVWVRTKTHPRYEIWAPDAVEPEVYAKTGGKVPEDVQALLRMNLVHLEESNRKIDVHLGNQREPIFLLNEPGSAFAQFFAASTEGAHLLAMQDALKDKAQSARRTRDENKRRLAAIEAGLDALAPLPALEMSRQKAEVVLEEIATLQAGMPQLNTRIQTMRTLKSRLLALGRSTQVLDTLTTPRELLPVAALARMAGEIRGLFQNVVLTRKREQALAPLQAVPALYPTARLATLLARLRRGRIQQEAWNKRQKELAPLHEAPSLTATASMARLLEHRNELQQGIRNAQHAATSLVKLKAAPELFSIYPLEQAIGKLRGLDKKVAAMQKGGDVLTAVAAPPELHNPKPLEQRVKDLKTMGARLEALRAQATRQEQALQACRHRLEVRLKEMGDCPTCGAPLDAQRFLEKGHFHG